jgi:hypothetical protein
MTADANTHAPTRVLDKRLLRQSVAALQARLGLSHDPGATAEQAQAIALASGVMLEDRVLSSEVLRMRQEGREPTQR